MAHEQVPLPMTRHGPIGDLGGPFVDADDVLNGARREADLAGAAKPVPATQIPGQLSLERAARQHIEIGIDRFGRDAHRRIIRIALWKAVGNLFGRPALGQEPEDYCPQAGLGYQLSRLARPMRSAVRPLMGNHRPIRQRRHSVARQLAYQRTGRTAQHISGRAKAVPDGKQATNFFSLHEGQSSIPDHVQLLRSWVNQDTSVALRTRAQTDPFSYFFNMAGAHTSSACGAIAT